MNEIETKEVYLVEKLQELGIIIIQLSILHFFNLPHERHFDLLDAVSEKVTIGSCLLIERVLPDPLEENCVDEHHASQLVKRA
jgi:hypothetical protein